MVEMLGGRMWVESEMGVGTTFSFILPLATNTTPRGERSSLVPDFPAEMLTYPEDEEAE
jgi:hypothetical protein